LTSKGYRLRASRVTENPPSSTSDKARTMMGSSPRRSSNNFDANHPSSAIVDPASKPTSQLDNQEGDLPDHRSKPGPTATPTFMSVQENHLLKPHDIMSAPFSTARALDPSPRLGLSADLSAPHKDDYCSVGSLDTSRVLATEYSRETCNDLIRVADEIQRVRSPRKPKANHSTVVK
jgi:hypothetical protein